MKKKKKTSQNFEIFELNGCSFFELTTSLEIEQQTFLTELTNQIQ